MNGSKMKKWVLHLTVEYKQRPKGLVFGNNFIFNCLLSGKISGKWTLLTVTSKPEEIDLYLGMNF